MEDFMTQGLEIRPVLTMSDELNSLMVEADLEGHHFMRRLRKEWEAGLNRFDGDGEFLLGAYCDQRLCGVGGLNADPYSSLPAIGRLRHLYVAPPARRLGIGTMLVNEIRVRAMQRFLALRLRTSSVAAAAFYDRLGFEKTDEEAASTHFSWNVSR
ncbi:GNAT family N-acetyltransferase, partial [Bradyrhizobium japonicum]|uniref:GNAT family N-acetyltransferase n=2 Tax=Bradyrhizobium japonicum TaxID=375 RepID=UPI0012FD973B